MTAARGAGPALLFVHAHPDDETLATGIALAHHRRLGHPVHVLTCTLGEEGEIIPAELARLAADQEGTLGPWRRRELAAAMAVLDVEHRVLGEDPVSGAGSRFRDSGMAGSPSAAHPWAFSRADVREVAARVAEVIRELAPGTVVTYDAEGGYGHPDHIQTHRVTCAAVASLPPESRPDLYAVLTPRSWGQEDRAWLAANVPSGTGWAVPRRDDPFPASVVDDALVTHEVVAPDLVPLQEEALRAHRTQVSIGRGCYALSNGIAARLSGREGFARLDPLTGRPVPAPHGRGGRRTALLAPPGRGGPA